MVAFQALAGLLTHSWRGMGLVRDHGRAHGRQRDRRGSRREPGRCWCREWCGPRHLFDPGFVTASITECGRCWFRCGTMADGDEEHQQSDAEGADESNGEPWADAAWLPS